MATKRPVAAHAHESIERLCRKHKLHLRTGGTEIRDLALERAKTADFGIEVHGDSDGLKHATDAILRAIHATERVQQEHADANAHELAVERAHVFLVQALLLLSCAEKVNYHGERIEHARNA